MAEIEQTQITIDPPEIDKDKARALWLTLSADFNLGDFPSFLKGMSDEGVRGELFDAASPTYDIGEDIKAFEALIFVPEAEEKEQKPAAEPGRFDAVSLQQETTEIDTGAPTDLEISQSNLQFDTGVVTDFRKRKEELQLQQEEAITLSNEDVDEVTRRVAETNSKGGETTVLTFFKRLLNSQSFGSIKGDLLNVNDEVTKEEEKRQIEFRNSLSEEDLGILTSAAKLDLGKEERKLDSAEKTLEKLAGEVGSKSQLVTVAQKRIREMDGEIDFYKDLAKNNKATNEDITYVNGLIKFRNQVAEEGGTLVDELDSSHEEAQDALNQYEESEEKFGDLEKEIEIFRRNYSRWDTFISRAFMSLGNATANLKYGIESGEIDRNRKFIKEIVSKGNQHQVLYEDNIPAKYRISDYVYNEEEFDAETSKKMSSLAKSFATEKEISREIIESEFKPSVRISEQTTLNGIIDAVVFGIADQTSIIAEMSIPYIGTALFAADLMAGTLGEQRAERAFSPDTVSDIDKQLAAEGLAKDKRLELLEQKENAIKAGGLTDNQIMMASALKVAPEVILTRLIGTGKRVRTAKRILGNVGRKRIREGVRSGVKQTYKNYFKNLKTDTFKGIASANIASLQEVTEEILTGFAQRTVDKYVLGRTNVDIFNAKDMIDEGGVAFPMGFLFDAGPRVFARFLDRLVTPRRRRKIAKNMIGLSVATRKYNVAINQFAADGDLDAAEKLAKEFDIRVSKILLENKKLIGADIDAVDNMTIEDFKVLNELSNQQLGYEIGIDKYQQQIDNGELLNEDAQSVVDDLNESLNTVVTAKEALLYNPEEIAAGFDVANSTINQDTVNFGAGELGDLFDISDIAKGMVELRMANGARIQYKKEGDKITIENIVFARTSNITQEKQQQEAVIGFFNKAVKQGATVETRVAAEGQVNREAFNNIFVNSPLGFTKEDGTTTNINEGDVLVRKPEQGEMTVTTAKFQAKTEAGKNLQSIIEQADSDAGKKPIKSDFDGTLYANNKLTPLGEDIKTRIQNGEDVTILTAREDTAENRAFIAGVLGVAVDKIKLGLSPEQKADNVNDGDVFFDDNQANIDAVNSKFADGGVEVNKEGALTAEPVAETTKETADVEKQIKESKESTEQETKPDVLLKKTKEIERRRVEELRDNDVEMFVGDNNIDFRIESEKTNVKSAKENDGNVELHEEVLRRFQGYKVTIDKINAKYDAEITATKKVEKVEENNIVQTTEDAKGRTIEVESTTTTKDGITTTKFTAFRIDEKGRRKLNTSGITTTLGEAKSKMDEKFAEDFEGVDDNTQVFIIEERTSKEGNSFTFNLKGVKHSVAAVGQFALTSEVQPKQPVTEKVIEKKTPKKKAKPIPQRIADAAASSDAVSTKQEGNKTIVEHAVSILGLTPKNQNKKRAEQAIDVTVEVRKEVKKEEKPTAAAESVILAEELIKASNIGGKVKINFGKNIIRTYGRGMVKFLKENGYDVKGSVATKEIPRRQAEGISKEDFISEEEAREMTTLLSLSGLQESVVVLSNEDINAELERQGVDGVRLSASRESAVRAVADRKLAALHNLSEKNFLKALELDGLAAPSIAIVDTTLMEDYDMFDSEVTVVFGKETVDPEVSPFNFTFDRDAYTATYPNGKTIYSLNEKDFEKHYEDITKRLEVFGISIGDFGGLVSPKLGHILQKTMYKNALTRSGGNIALTQFPAIQALYHLENNLSTKEEVAAALSMAVKEDSAPLGRAVFVREIGMNDVQNKEFSTWSDTTVKSELKSLERFILIAGDTTSPVTLPYNLESIVEAMKQETLVLGQQEFNGTFGALAARFARLVKSFADLKKTAENNIISATDSFTEEAVTDLVEERQDLVNRIKQEFLAQGFNSAKTQEYNYTDRTIQDEHFGADGLYNEIIYAMHRKQTEKGFVPFYEQDGIKFSDNLTEDANVFSEELRDKFRSRYIEAKPMRPVPFSEVKAVVVSNTFPKEAVQKLRDLGITVKIYNNKISEISKDLEFTKEFADVNEKAAKTLEILEAEYKKLKGTTQSEARKRAFFKHRFQRSAAQNGVNFTTYGFTTEDGTVYINKDFVKKDTPIHEFGHLWNSYMKENHNDHYQAGLKLVENTEYHDRVRTHPAYQGLSKEAMLEEALALAIGERGARIWETAKKSKFNQWLTDLFRKIAAGLGIRNMTPEAVSRLTVEQFADLAAAELLSGKDIRTGKEGKAFGTTAANIRKQRQTLNEKFSQKNISADAIRGLLVKYIRDVINTQAFNKEGRKGELNRLMTLVKNTKSVKKLRDAMTKVSEISTDIDNRVLKEKIKKLQGLKRVRSLGGKPAANTIDGEARDSMDAFDKHTDASETVVVPPARRNKKGRQKQKIAELSELLAPIQEQLIKEGDLSEELILEFEQLNTAINFLEAEVATDPIAANALYADVFNSLSHVVQHGRSRLKEIRKQEKDRFFQEVRNPIIEDIKGSPSSRNKKKTASLTALEVATRGLGVGKSLLIRGRSRLFGSSSFLLGGMDRVAFTISQSEGDTRDDSPMVQFVNRVKQREVWAVTKRKELAKTLSDARKKIFGSEHNSIKELNKIIEVTVYRNPDNTNTLPKAKVTLSFQQAELLNVYMNARNPDLLDALEQNGFDADALAEIERKLSPQAKRYAQSLWEFYEDIYNMINPVYKSMYHFSLPKVPFYAGKLVRGDRSALYEEVNLFNSYAMGTTGYGSLKSRTESALPLEAVNVNVLANRAIFESVHFAAFAKEHKDMARFVGDPEFEKNILRNFPTVGDILFKRVKNAKERLEVGRTIGSSILDFFARNATRSILAAKSKIMFTQMISFFNGAADLPFGVAEKNLITYYEPVRLYSEFAKLIKKSTYLQNRYDIGGLENAVLGLSDLAKKSEFQFRHYPSIEAKRRTAARFFKKGMDMALLNVKFGDAIGISGAIPVYLAWKDVYKARGMSDSEADAAAIEKFESSVDRSQQPNTVFGKSEFQNHPYLRYLAMFATAPIQNFNNASFHLQELERGIRKDKKMKGTYVGNTIGLLNYGLIQPVAYAYMYGLFAGSLTPFFFTDDEDEAPKEADKDLARAFILGNFEAIPIVGGVLEFLVDSIVLGKEKSFGSFVSSAVLDELQSVLDSFMDAKNAKTIRTREKHLKELRTKLAGLISGTPQLLINIAQNWDMIFTKNEIKSEIKTKILLGWSRFNIEQAGKKRITWKENREKLKENKQNILDSKELKEAYPVEFIKEAYIELMEEEDRIEQ